MEATSWENSKNWCKFRKLIREGVLSLDDLATILPGVLHINSRHDFSFRYLSHNGCELIGYTRDQLRKQGSQLLQKHQSSFTREITHPKVFNELNKKDPNKVILYYQDWKRPNKTPFFFLTTTRVWNQEEFISISFFPDQVDHITQKINQLFGINRLFCKYYQAYNKLTRREKEILELLGKDLTRCEIATQLFVSDATIKKHCENIYSKLGTHKRTELEKIAIAFVSMDK